MVIHGRVHHGVVVLDGNAALPEGSEVTVVCSSVSAPVSHQPKQRIQPPLVPSDHPGTLNLTAERIAELA